MAELLLSSGASIDLPDNVWHKFSWNAACSCPLSPILQLLYISVAVIYFSIASVGRKEPAVSRLHSRTIGVC